MSARFPRPPRAQKGGFALSFPDVCKVPAPPAPFAPVPMPNIATASKNMKGTKVKILSKKKELEKLTKSSQGDESGTQKGVVASKAMDKMASLFLSHSSKIKVTGKKVAILTDHKAASKHHKKAVTQQKTFQTQLKAECDKLTEACKDDPKQAKLAKKIVDMVTKAAVGIHR